MKRSLVFSLAALVAAATALASAAQIDGPEWVEGGGNQGDAGSGPGDAQNTTGKGAMMGISGNLGTALDGATDFEDMFWIFIDDPEAFLASTSIEFNGFAQFDSQLWLFQPVTFGQGGGTQALGLLGNDEAQGFEEGASRLLQNSDDDSGAFVAERGLYLLAITRFDNDPFSSNGLIFNQIDRFEISGPDGSGGQSPFLGWTGEGEGGQGGSDYRIRLGGVTFANLPAPGALGLLGLAAALGGRRRRG